MMLLFFAVAFFAIASNPRIIDGATTREYLKNYGDNNGLHERRELVTFCTIIPGDYPQEEINNILEKKKTFLQPTPIKVEPRQKRMSDEDNDIKICNSDITYEPLFKIRRSDGVWRTVIQSPEKNFIQRIRLETCTNPGASCSEDTEKPIGISKPSCRQIYTNMELFVMKGNNETEKIMVELPTSCACYMEHSALLNDV